MEDIKMKKIEIVFAVAGSITALAGEARAGNGTAGADQYLFPGQRLTQSCYHGLVMQSDGNLVIYNNFGSSGSWHAEWSSDTANHRGGYAIMQSDGNFVIYNWADSPVWATNTAGHPGARVVQQDDGNLVVYLGSTPLWASDTAGEAVGQNTCSFPQTKTQVYANIDRPGGDYKSLILNQARPSWCGYFCSQDPNCRSYTYVPSGIQGPGARCWLKSTIPAPVMRSGMISGHIFRESP